MRHSASHSLLRFWVKSHQGAQWQDNPQPLPETLRVALAIRQRQTSCRALQES
jgi:hypothetical protein